MIELVKFNDLVVRVSGFQRKSSLCPQEFDLVLLLPGPDGHRDFTHILNEDRIRFTILDDDGTEEAHLVEVVSCETRLVGTGSAQRTRYALTLREAETAATEPAHRDELLAALDDVQRAIDRLRALLAGAREPHPPS